LLAGLFLLTITTSCIEESTWASDLPNRHDLLREEVTDSLSVLLEETGDLYGIVLYGPTDSILLKQRDSETEDVEIRILENSVWIDVTITHEDESTSMKRCEVLYHNFGSVDTGWYPHEPEYDHLHASEDTRAINLYLGRDIPHYLE
jgi:hypothetical protein